MDTEDMINQIKSIEDTLMECYSIDSKSINSDILPIMRMSLNNLNKFLENKDYTNDIPKDVLEELTLSYLNLCNVACILDVFFNKEINDIISK